MKNQKQATTKATTKKIVKGDNKATLGGGTRCMPYMPH